MTEIERKATKATEMERERERENNKYVKICSQKGTGRKGRGGKGFRIKKPSSVRSLEIAPIAFLLPPCSKQPCRRWSEWRRRRDQKAAGGGLWGEGFSHFARYLVAEPLQRPTTASRGYAMRNMQKLFHKKVETGFFKAVGRGEFRPGGF